MPPKRAKKNKPANRYGSRPLPAEMLRTRSTNLSKAAVAREWEFYGGLYDTCFTRKNRLLRPASNRVIENVRAATGFNDLDEDGICRFTLPTRLALYSQFCAGQLDSDFYYLYADNDDFDDLDDDMDEFMYSDDEAGAKVVGELDKLAADVKQSPDVREYARCLKVIEKLRPILTELAHEQFGDADAVKEFASTRQQYFERFFPCMKGKDPDFDVDVWRPSLLLLFVWGSEYRNEVRREERLEVLRGMGRARAKQGSESSDPGHLDT